MGFVVGDCQGVKKTKAANGRQLSCSKIQKVQKTRKREETPSSQTDFLRENQEAAANSDNIVTDISVPLPPLPPPLQRTTVPVLTVAPADGFLVSLLFLR